MALPGYAAIQVWRRWPVELRQPRHFLALAEERSITRAAKRELIVQSGLSNSLQALERELAVGETSPAARRFADQLLRIHPAGS